MLLIERIVEFVADVDALTAPPEVPGAITELTKLVVIDPARVDPDETEADWVIMLTVEDVEPGKPGGGGLTTALVPDPFGFGVASMASRRLGVGIAVLNGQLYAVGGSDGQQPLSSVEHYDPRVGTWHRMSCMGTNETFAWPVYKDLILCAWRVG
ncbi:Kelch protein 20 [Fasciola gigantica]|uniref:Kelch protein 20 n=1 Tax=Fasciola gigantica TaxID=46835 RepID=A0A504YXD5_FASGI|nr:Kelch protein 20 [Fasciola gigantica]